MTHYSFSPTHTMASSKPEIRICYIILTKYKKVIKQNQFLQGTCFKKSIKSIVFGFQLKLTKIYKDHVYKCGRSK